MVTRACRSVTFAVKLCAPELAGLQVMVKGGAVTVPIAVAPSRKVRLATAASLVVVAVTVTVLPTSAPAVGALTVGVTLLSTKAKIVTRVWFAALSVALTLTECQPAAQVDQCSTTSRRDPS